MQSQVTEWQPSQQDIDEKPWKYAGYQSFSTFIASDNDFLVFRKFGTLSARVLLNLQDQLSCVEEDLEACEKRVRGKDAPDIHNGSFRQESQKDRQNLVYRAQHLLREYNELILQHSQIRARPPVPKQDIRHLGVWLSNKTNAILDEEKAYINYPSDLFSLVPAPRSLLRSFLERSLHFRLFKLWQQERPDHSESAGQDVHFFSGEKMDRFIAIFILCLGLAMLIAPLWILAFLEEIVPRLAVISAFIVLFVMLLSFATIAKTFECLAAAAAYSAVMMVFLQISGTN